MPLCCPAALYFSSKGLWNPVASADLHLLLFLGPVVCCLFLFVFFFSSEMPVFFVFKCSEQGLFNLQVQKSRL